MSDGLDLEIEVDGIEAVCQDIQDSFDDAVDDSQEDIGRGMKATARQQIVDEGYGPGGAVWTGELINSFKVEEWEYADEFYISLINYSDHAIYVEEGAEYAAKAPPVEALKPWVRDKLAPFYRPSSSGGFEELANGPIKPTPQRVEELAFALQEILKTRGLRAVGFMEAAEDWAFARGYHIVRENINKHMDT